MTSLISIRNNTAFAAIYISHKIERMYSSAKALIQRVEQAAKSCFFSVYHRFNYACRPKARVYICDCGCKVSAADIAWLEAMTSDKR